MSACVTSSLNDVAPGAGCKLQVLLAGVLGEPIGAAIGGKSIYISIYKVVAIVQNYP